MRREPGNEMSVYAYLWSLTLESPLCSKEIKPVNPKGNLP